MIEDSEIQSSIWNGKRSPSPSGIQNTEYTLWCQAGSRQGSRIASVLMVRSHLSLLAVIWKAGYLALPSYVPCPLLLLCEEDGYSRSQAMFLQAETNRSSFALLQALVWTVEPSHPDEKGTWEGDIWENSSVHPVTSCHQMTCHSLPFLWNPCQPPTIIFDTIHRAVAAATAAVCRSLAARCTAGEKTASHLSVYQEGEGGKYVPTNVRDTSPPYLNRWTEGKCQIFSLTADIRRIRQPWCSEQSWEEDCSN